LPDQLVQIALLAQLAVDLQLHPSRGRMSGLAGGLQRPHRPGALESLADLPGPAELLRLALQVAPRHVEPDAVAPDAVHRLLYGDIHAAALQRDDEFDLVMDVRGHRRIGELAGEIEIVGVLLEEERRLAVGVMP